MLDAIFNVPPHRLTIVQNSDHQAEGKILHRLAALVLAADEEGVVDLVDLVVVVAVVAVLFDDCSGVVGGSITRRLMRQRGR